MVERGFEKQLIKLEDTVAEVMKNYVNIVACSVQEYVLLQTLGWLVDEKENKDKVQVKKIINRLENG